MISIFTAPVQVNVSSTFMIRCRCKRCGKNPSVHRYFYFKNPNYWKSPRKQIERFSYIKKHVKRFCEDYYLSNKPSKYTNMSIFSHSPTYKGFNPKLHKNKGVLPFDDYAELITCPCGRTTWSFYQKSILERFEIINRKAKYNY